MKISEILDTRKSPLFSFEFFPPKTPDGERNLFKTIRDLKELNPDYVSITFGAGGSERRNTVGWVSEIQNNIGITAMAHLTCIGSAKNDIQGFLDGLKSNNINNILALRGDIPKDSTGNEGGDFKYATDLISFIKDNPEDNSNFVLGAAAYPEVHPEAKSAESDLAIAKQKQDLGTEFFITQLFFNNEDYFVFCEKARQAGITVPIVAGIMPITNFKQIQRFAAGCGASIPEELREQMLKVQDDEKSVFALGVKYASEQCLDLMERGAPGIHFYTLNKSPATSNILANIRKQKG